MDLAGGGWIPQKKNYKGNGIARLSPPPKFKGSKLKSEVFYLIVVSDACMWVLYWKHSVVDGLAEGHHSLSYR